MKKILLTLGSLVTIAAPVAAVVSCGAPSSSEYSQDDLLKMSNLKSSEAHTKLQDLWLSKVIKNLYSINAKVTPDGSTTAHEATNMDILTNLANTTSTTGTTVSTAFEDDFKKTLIWVLKNKLFSSKDALSSIYQSLKTNAIDEVVNTSSASGKEKDVVKALNTKVFDRSEINDKVKAVFNNDDWKDIFYNITTNSNDETFNPTILGVKDLILKMLITKKYLAISEDKYKSVVSEEYAKVDSKFKDSTLITSSAGYYPLLVSVMNSRLAYKSSIELDASKSSKYIISNIENKLEEQEAKDVFDKTKSKFNTDSKTAENDSLPYSIRSKTRVDEILAKKTGLNSPTTEANALGFEGLSSLPDGKDELNTSSASAIKLITDADARDGFVVTSKTGTKLVKAKDGVRFTDEDKTKVTISYYTSLMPTYHSGSLSFDTGIDMDILMNEAYSKDTSLFSAATKYFTSEENNDQVLVNVTNDWARNYYIDEGLTYVDPKNEGNKN